MVQPANPVNAAPEINPQLHGKFIRGAAQQVAEPEANKAEAVEGESKIKLGRLGKKKAGMGIYIIRYKRWSGYWWGRLLLPHVVR